MTTQPDRLPMTDTCWCGCARDTRRGSFFVQGHDKIAEAALLALDHGDSVPAGFTSAGMVRAGRSPLQQWNAAAGSGVSGAAVRAIRKASGSTRPGTRPATRIPGPPELQDPP